MGARMHPQGWQAVLFDLDGTLADTAADIHAACNAMLEHVGRPPWSLSAVADLVGKGAEHFVTQVVGPEALATCLPVFLAHYHANNGRYARVFAGVREGLDELRRAGLALGVVTNKPRALTVPLLQQLALAPDFSVIVAGGDTPERKPDPAPVLRACTTLGVAPWATLVVGDSGNDVGAAHAAGCPCVLVPYGYSEGCPVQSLGSDGIVSTLADVVRWLDAHAALPQSYA